MGGGQFRAALAQRLWKLVAVAVATALLVVAGALAAQKMEACSHSPGGTRNRLAGPFAEESSLQTTQQNLDQFGRIQK